jgi:hypothetical protein
VTDPIKPAPKPVVPGTSTGSAAKPATKAATPEKKKEAPKEKITRGAAKDYKTQSYGVSPIQSQKLYGRGGEGILAPVKITPLSGRYAGITWEIGGTLGIAIDKVSQAYSSKWEPDKGKLAPTLSFKSQGADTFSLVVSFYDPVHDVLHLTEGLKHLREISGQDTTPPLLIYRQGDMVNCNVVLTDVNVEFKEPHPGNLRGFSQAEATLKFTNYAGAGSANAQLGAPFTSTPQNQKASSQTSRNRIKESRKRLVDAALAECLPTVARQQIESAIENDKLGDVATLQAMDPNAFVSLAIAGKILPATLAGPLNSKLRTSLALFVAQSEDGISSDSGTTPEGVIQGGLGVDSRMAEYFIANDQDAPGKLSVLGSTTLQDQAVAARAAYLTILESVTAGNLNFKLTEPSDPAFAVLKRKGFQCASQLARVDVSSLNGRSEAGDPAAINKLKLFYETNRQPDGKLSGENITTYKAAFGLENESEIKQLFAILPVNSKNDFVAAVNSTLAKNNPKISGLVLFSKFSNYTPPVVPPTGP